MEKKHTIMEAAAKLFAEKGYHATSIQDIADSLGIAKGSMYFYFKSKEDLLVHICKYYLDLFLKQFLALMGDTGQDPRARLSGQIVMKSRQFSANRDFIAMFIKESFEVNEEIHNMVQMLRARILFSTQSCVVELYGEAARPYAYDAAAIFNAMSDGYLGLMLMDQMDLDVQAVSLFLVDRLDDVVKGMMTGKAKAMLRTEAFRDLIVSGQQNERRKVELLAELQAIREIVGRIRPEPGKLEEIESSLLVLEEEFEKPEYPSVLIKGMLALLKNMGIPEIRSNIARMESYIGG